MRAKAAIPLRARNGLRPAEQVAVEGAVERREGGKEDLPRLCWNEQSAPIDLLGVIERRFARHRRFNGGGADFAKLEFSPLLKGPDADRNLGRVRRRRRGEALYVMSLSSETARLHRRPP